MEIVWAFYGHKLYIYSAIFGEHCCKDGRGVGLSLREGFWRRGYDTGFYSDVRVLLRSGRGACGLGIYNILWNDYGAS